MTNQPHSIDTNTMDLAANEVSEMLKVLSNPARLRLLCALVKGERSVSELETCLGASQAYVSGQLALMRAEGLVTCNRDGRNILYRLDDDRLEPILQALYDAFCQMPKPAP